MNCAQCGRFLPVLPRAFRIVEPKEKVLPSDKEQAHDCTWGVLTYRYIRKVA